MSVIYRAVWTDARETDGEGYISLARDYFSKWAKDDPDGTTLPDGESTWGQRTVRLRSLRDGPALGLEATRSERSVGPSGIESQWDTSLRVVATSDRIHVWVETQMESDDVTQRVKVGRPRLVSDLLAIGGKPALGGSALLTDVLELNGDGAQVLIEALQDPSRTLPFIVFSAPRVHEVETWRRYAQRVATRSEGIANVAWLDSEGTDVFHQALGDLAIWGGAVRTYMPVPLVAADAWRHRYITGQRVREFGDPADRLVYGVAQASTRRPVPGIFNLFNDAGAQISEQELAHMRQEFEFQLELEQEDRGELEAELGRTKGHLDRLVSALRARGMEELIWATHDPDPSQDLPDTVQDVSEAVLAAQVHLGEWLTIPESAARELDGIDAATNAYAWGNTTWRGLRALAAFVGARRDGFSGGFWAWCERGEPSGWPATPKKLAINESETVQKSSSLMKYRLFEVDRAVKADGKLHMQSHLKISEGGGDLAPRVYFYDDTAGTTRKVHIGLVGPHYLVPNTKS